MAGGKVGSGQEPGRMRFPGASGPRRGVGATAVGAWRDQLGGAERGGRGGQGFHGQDDPETRAPGGSKQNGDATDIS